MKKEEAVAYVRISIEDQSKYSLPTQVADVENYCKRNDLDLRKVFIENGGSAFTFQRKEWKQLEAFIKANKSVKYLVVIAMDRFSRADLPDALIKMNEIQRRIDVKILTVYDPINLDVHDENVEFRRIIDLFLANQELKKIRKRTSDGLYGAMSTGYFANKAPFGYVNTKTDEIKPRPTLKIDDEKAYIVRLVFRLFLKGSGLEEIRKHIAATTGKAIKGNSAIRRMLENPVYAGLINVRKRGNEPARQVKGVHPPLVTEFDYWAVQQKLEGRSITQQKKEEVYLRGVLHCNECSRLMTSGKSKGRKQYYWYYYCKTHMKNYRATLLHEKFEELLQNLSLPEKAVQMISDRLEAAINHKTKNKGGDLMRAKLNLQKIQDKISAVEEKYLLSPDMSETTYKKVISGLKNDERLLHEQLAELNTGAERYQQIKAGLMPYLSNIKSQFLKWELFRQQAFVDTVFSRSLSWTGEMWRTAKLHPIFASNELILKEKGLIEIDQPSANLGVTPVRSGIGS